MARTYKAYLLLVALIAGCVGLLLPAPVGAQGGNAVYNSLRVAVPIERRYLEPQGLQDAAYDLLTADMSTMSSTYQTILSASVTVGESGDAVTVHVTGQIGWMGAALYVVDDGRATELWRIDDPTAPGSAVAGRLIPIRALGPRPASRRTAGRSTWWRMDAGEELWRIDDPTAPGVGVAGGLIPIRAHEPATGITSHGGALYVVDNGNAGDELWRIDDPTAPGAAVDGRLIPIRAYVSRPASRRTAGRSTSLDGWSPQRIMEN